MQDKPRKLKILRRIMLTVLALAVLLPVGARIWMSQAMKGRVYTHPAEVPSCDVALVLGALVRPNGSLSDSLANRCDTAIKLYKAGKVKKLLMSGDNRFKHYNEPERMRDYAVEHGVPAKDIALDYAGRRTYDSMYRAKHIFGLNRIIIVTQKFHMPRSLYLAKAVGVDAYGVITPDPGNFRSNIREIPACLSALLDVYVLHPRPVMGKKEKI